MSIRHAGALLACLVWTSILCGCGLGAGKTPTNVQLTVTREFGSRLMHAWSAPSAHGEETVMSLLTRNADVSTRYGGGFVQSIDGAGPAEDGGTRSDWFYYVNGVQAPKGAASTTVHPGDRIWWDLHNWSQTEEVPAVVGSFPEPFLAGIEGKRLPVRIECAQPAEGACKTVMARLRGLGVPAALGAMGPAGEGPETLRVLVGAWRKLRSVPAAQQIEGGPGVSGVYARPAPTGASIALLDPEGRPVRTLGAGAGLIAATGHAGQDPVWVVTGTDPAGTDLAAQALDGTDLRDRFALAIEPPGRLLGVPVTEG